MNLARIIDEYLDALANARLAFRSPSILAPFIAFGLLQCGLIALLAFFTWTPTAGVMIAIVNALGGEPSLHYPTHFILLPATYRKIYLPLAATAGFALWSYAVWLMIEHHEAATRMGRRSFRAALPGVVVVGLVFVGVTVGLGRGLGTLAAYLPAGIPARAGTLLVVAVTASAQALLLYAPIVLRLQGGGPLGAVRNSIRYALRHFGATAMLVATVLLVHIPLDTLIANSESIVARFRPEAVFQLLIASAVLEAATAFVLFAGAVALALPEEGGLR